MIEVGKYYKTRIGQEVFIVGIDPYTELNKFVAVGKDSHRRFHISLDQYFENGNWCAKEYEEGEEYPQDIVEEVL